MIEAPLTRQLVDPFGRTIDYLRVSVTDRCNFRCVYCMPEQGFPCTPKDEQLTAEELVRIVRVAISLGIRKVRLTGGEPLLRKDLPWIAREITACGLSDLSCTTNGFLLDETAEELLNAGVHRFNVSLDTLQAGKFQQIARRGTLDKVFTGIKRVQQLGGGPVKINCVAMRGVNDDEAAEFARWTMREPVHVRFIELMPLRWSLDSSSPFDAFAAHPGQGLLQLSQARGDMLSDLQMRRMFIPLNEVKRRIEDELGSLEPAEVKTNGPARTFRIPGAEGTIGFISQITNDFCDHCNRIRLTHDGYLRPCLMSDGELDLKPTLRSAAGSDEEVAALFRHVVEHKPERHFVSEGQSVTGRGMSQIGG